MRSGFPSSETILLIILAVLAAGLLGLARAQESATEPIIYAGKDQIVASIVSAMTPAATAERSSASLRGAARLVAVGVSLLGTATLLRRAN